MRRFISKSSLNEQRINHLNNPITVRALHHLSLLLSNNQKSRFIEAIDYGLSSPPSIKVRKAIKRDFFPFNGTHTTDLSESVNYPGAIYARD